MPCCLQYTQHYAVQPKAPMHVSDLDNTKILYIRTRSHVMVLLRYDTAPEQMAESLIDLEELLQRNSDEYQQHLTTRNRIAKALHYQNNIRLYLTIPKRLRPTTTLEVIPPNSDLTKQFEEEYHQLFFRHLNLAITHNTTTLELENARLREIVTRTEKLLTTTDAPAETIERLKLEFYRKNNLNQHNASTSKQLTPTTEIPASPPISRNSEPKHPKKNKKRKISCQPNERKSRKIEHHFLSQRHNQKPPT